MSLDRKRGNRFLRPLIILQNSIYLRPALPDKTKSLLKDSNSIFQIPCKFFRMVFLPRSIIIQIGVLFKEVTCCRSAVFSFLEFSVIDVLLALHKRNLNIGSMISPLIQLNLRKIRLVVHRMLECLLIRTGDSQTNPAVFLKLIGGRLDMELKVNRFIHSLRETPLLIGSQTRMIRRSTLIPCLSRR